MKKLTNKLGYAICILLMCVFCDANAQYCISYQSTTTEGAFTDSLGITGNITADNGITFADFDIKPLVTINGDSSKVMFYGAELLTVQLLFKYEIECYNDSSKVLTHECPANMPGCLVYHTWYKTVHKEPTFSDFIAWLRKKYCN